MTAKAPASPPASPPQVSLMGLPVHSVTEEQCLEHVAACWEAGVGGWIHTVNLDHLRMIHGGKFMPEGLPDAELRVCDGAPLIWASRLQKTPLPERVAGSDLIRSLTRTAAEHRRKVFFLGGNPGAAEGAAEQLTRESPGFEVAGLMCPEFGFEKDPAQLKAITDALQEARPDLVFVAVGAPKSERLIQEWRELLPGTWWAGVGISFSFVTGEVKRAPRWMQVSGLEWVHRLLQEPRRLAKRYLVHDLPFAMKLFAASLRARRTAKA